MADRHALEINGYNALLADYCATRVRVAQLNEQIIDLYAHITDLTRRIQHLETIQLRQADRDAHNSG